MAEIASLTVADAPGLWCDLGFVVDDDRCWISGACHQLGAAGDGVLAWCLRDAEAISELPTAPGGPRERRPTPAHPNQVIALDHVVVTTPDLARTVAALEAGGLVLRRTREAGTPERPLRQAFFKLGETVVEVVGPSWAARPGPARFYGLAFTVADLDVTAELLGDRLRPAQDAVQPGRRIATLDRTAGSTVPLAFLSPEPRHPRLPTGHRAG